MSLYPQYPESLSRGEFAAVRFALELQEDGKLALDHLLGLRSGLRRAARACLGERAGPLFDPLPGPDPDAVRRFQKPAPGFVLRPDVAAAGPVAAGDRLDLEVLFVGTAVQAIGDFCQALRVLGEQGLADNGLRFEVAGADSLGLDGGRRPLWQPSRRSAEPLPELLLCDQWLDQHWPRQLPVTLQVATPMRLVARGQLLRRPRFSQLFPFVLRRVTSMLYVCCALEPVSEPGLLLAAARDVVATWDATHWVDWRETADALPVGGLTGTLRLDGAGLQDVLWVVMLATLFGVGRGATYGAGRLRLVSD